MRHATQREGLRLRWLWCMIALWTWTTTLRHEPTVRKLRVDSDSRSLNDLGRGGWTHESVGLEACSGRHPRYLRSPFFPGTGHASERRRSLGMHGRRYFKRRRPRGDTATRRDLRTRG